jgi:hypothetical protein
MMMLLAVPVIGYVEQKPALYIWALVLMAAMMGVLFLLIFLNKRVRAIKDTKLAASSITKGSPKTKKKGK